VTAERFQAMGCEVVVGGARPEELVAVKDLFAGWERTFSRFLPGSELNRVNASAGRPVVVSPLFSQALEVSLQAAEETGGLVDPTVGRALETAGYVDDFDRLLPDATPAGPPATGAWESVVCRGRLVSVPAGIRLDLNGVVKALAVDASLTLLSGDAFVSAGGDLATRAPLTTSLPGEGTVLLQSGALATSGTAKRRWLRGGELQHHLIDPRTGLPSESPWSQVTTCGATCVAADVAAKAGFLAGADGPAWLDARGLPGRFLDDCGEVVVNDCWRRSMDEALACT
jgi:thiamine biosynthesis lipoprotein